MTGAEIFIQPGDSIQTAVNNATLGDEIIIKPGTYTENILISTDNLVVRSESGDPENTVIRARSSGSHVFSVQADSVRISGLKITGTKASYAGIQLSGCNNCVIENNRLLNNGYGIYLLSSRGSTVSNNIVTNNGDYGIVLASSTGSKLTGNTASSNNGRGIHLGNSDSNTLSGNTIASNGVYGLYVCPRSDNNLVFNNYLVNDVNAEIKNGTGNAYSTAKTTGTNIIGGPYKGGNFWGKPDGSGFSETTTDADGDGFSDLPYRFENSVYEDFLPLVSAAKKPAEEPEPVLPVPNPVADFKASVTEGPAPLSVQFTDLSEKATEREWDFDNDGKIDSTDKSRVYVYTTPGTYTARLTVSNEKGTDSKTATITVKEKGEDDAAGSGAGNNGTANESTENEETINNRPGSDETGEKDVIGREPADSETTGNDITQENAGSENAERGNEGSSYLDGGDSGSGNNGNEKSSGENSGNANRGSSGGAGSSPEPARNVRAKELSQAYITNGKEAKFDFANDATCVVYISFDSRKTAGKTTTIVEELKGKSVLVSDLPSDKVYLSFNVWVGNSGFETSKNMENSILCFRVENTWIQKNRIDSSSIVLNRYNDGKWEQLPVTVLNEDHEFTYFTAETAGFSSFAITSKVSASTEGNATGSAAEPKTRSADLGSSKSTVPEAEQVSEKEKTTGFNGFGAISEIGSLLVEWIEYIRSWVRA